MLSFVLVNLRWTRIERAFSAPITDSDLEDRLGYQRIISPFYINFFNKYMRNKIIVWKIFLILLSQQERFMVDLTHETLCTIPPTKILWLCSIIVAG